MRHKIVAGNWKMHGSRAENAALLEAMVGAVTDDRVSCVVCPPYVYLQDAWRLLRGSPVALGAQDVCAESVGAYTGEVSAAMLQDVGCRYTLVGHSERRALYGDSNALVARKFVAALSRELIPILCVGEQLAEREAGRTREVVGAQLDAVLQLAGVQSLGGAVLAYEPVWAIGTGRTATPEQAQEVHEFIRQRVASEDAKIAGGLRVLYGGSVKAGNARAIFAMPDVDGGLIGGASLKADEFLAIVAAAQVPSKVERKVMLHTALMVIHFFSAASIIALVLLQRGKGADAGAGFGAGASGTVFGARGAGTALSRATAILAGIFMLTSLSLTYVGSHTKAAPNSVLDRMSQHAPAQPGPGGSAPATPPPAGGAPASPAH